MPFSIKLIAFSINSKPQEMSFGEMFSISERKPSKVHPTMDFCTIFAKKFDKTLTGDLSAP